jgi:organic radical activating enzyme
MKLFELVLFQTCNYDCVDCPMKKWLYDADAVDENGDKRNDIDHYRLLQWLDKYLDPKEWFIDITGGEPGLYPKINKLLPQLNKRGYKGLIRTNGSQIIAQWDSFPRVATWHKDKNFPISYDFINILENPDDDWQAKKQHCIDNNIPYIAQPYRRYSLSDEKRCEEKRYATEPNKLFTEMTTMYSSGVLSSCFTAGDKGLSLQDMDAPAIYQIEEGCRYCPSVAGVELLIESIPDFKERCGITEDDEREEPRIFLMYPMLNAKSEWVNKDGEVIGVLGDDISTIPQEKVFI